MQLLVIFLFWLPIVIYSMLIWRWAARRKGPPPAFANGWSRAKKRALLWTMVALGVVFLIPARNNYWTWIPCVWKLPPDFGNSAVAVFTFCASIVYLRAHCRLAPFSDGFRSVSRSHHGTFSGICDGTEGLTLAEPIFEHEDLMTHVYLLYHLQRLRSGEQQVLFVGAYGSRASALRAIKRLGDLLVSRGVQTCAITKTTIATASISTESASATTTGLMVLAYEI